jgi:hypothetical protein
MMTAKMRKASIFKYRLVITIPPWGVLAMAGAIGIALVSQPMLVTNVVSIIITTVALILIYVARRQVRALRYDVHEALNNIGNDDLELDDTFETIDNTPETIRLKRVNGKRSARVSE